MELARASQRDVGLDRLAAHLAAFDPETESARDRLKREIGPDLATLLVAGLKSRSVTRPFAGTRAVAA
jgi:hypothetical protein